MVSIAIMTDIPETHTVAMPRLVRLRDITECKIYLLESRINMYATEIRLIRAKHARAPCEEYLRDIAQMEGFTHDLETQIEEKRTTLRSYVYQIETKRQN